MIPDEQPEHAPRDHNSPPGLLPLEQAVEEFDKFFALEPINGKTFAERKAEFLRAGRNAFVRDRESAGKAGDLLKLAKRARDRLQDARFDRSQPYRDTADALGRKCEDLWEDVDTAMDGVRALLKTWTDAEDARIEAQRIEQEAEMAAKLAAAEPKGEIDPAKEKAVQETTGAFLGIGTPLAPPRRKKIRGDLGATVSAVERFTYKVTDVRALPDYILNAPGVHEAIVSAVKSTRKVMGVPDGIEATPYTENQIR